MKVKEGVTLAGLKIEMRPVLICADKIWKENGQELVITEALGGVHSPGSLHPYGYALDKRTRYFKKEGQVEKVAQKLRDHLGSKYDVIVHSTHIHVEYDAVKR